ncbi:solute carrier family 26 protein [Oceaniserpentilla sp. 4NH20-0058]|uniref:SulP family inorganic anion transporter n=1 Tax=Oceaniserpentilla sp. 4NH20-0058 TaxID=3127660 RepID=UPI0031094825
MPNWLFPWRSTHWQLKDDAVAGLIVAILIIPQAIGYGLLAGLPPSVALASCILPLIAYAFLGKSHALAVGPVAIISLMVGDALQNVPQEMLIQAAQLLSLQVALCLATLRILNLGNLVHFIGHPVVQGFTTAAAVLIISKQVPHILGTRDLQDFAIDLPTAIFSGFALIFLVILKIFKLPVITKAAPLLLVGIGVLITTQSSITLNTVNMTQELQGFQLTWQLPWSLFNELLPNAALIAIIGFIESTSVAKNLAHKRKERVYANKELMGLSLANFAAAFSNAYPVAGGFGRTMVNDDAGATSPLAGVFTALYVVCFLLLASYLIQYIPMAALGAIVTLAVWTLLDFSPVFKHWRVQPKENSIWLVTFVIVLFEGVESGILAGVAVSIFFLIRSAAQPHIAIIGRIPGTAHFRNIKRHQVETLDNLLAIRIDEGLHFANRDAIDDFIERAIKQFPNAQNLLIVCSAVNVLDSDGIELLQIWHDNLLEQNKLLHLAEVKGPIMDELEKRGFIDKIKPGTVFLSTHQAFEALSQSTDAPQP